MPHWAIVEPIVLLAALVAIFRLTGWFLTRVAAWGSTRRRALRAG